MTRRTTRSAAGAAIAIVMSVAAGISAAPQASSAPPISSVSIALNAAQVPLNPQDLSQTAIGDFAYRGGLELTSAQTNQLHGLSDFDVSAANTLTAVGDLGVLFEARLVLDAAGQLAGLADGRLMPLVDEDGKPLADKGDADAEGLAVLANGDRLVSFERRDRIWLYPAAGGRPRAVPIPVASFPANGGMEALSADPAAGPDAYVVGAEVSGDTWTCRVQQPCIKAATVTMPEAFGLVAITRLPRSQTAYLLRAFDAERGNRNSLRIFGAEGLVAQMDIALPMTVDNFEGLAAVPREDGAIRFYLLSDDNARATERTLLLAFDWRPR